MVKIRDVAVLAGVSTATVSRVLNGKSTVDPVLVARVVEAADRLKYRPNALARSLRRRKTSIWALIISDIEHPFFTALARGVEDVAQESGYSVILCNADEDATKEALYLEVAEQEQVAGVILSPNSAASQINRLKAADIPLVTVDRELGNDVDSVLVDTETGAAHATFHLLDQGWVRPACITGPPDATTAVERRRGYERAMAERGRATDATAVHEAYRAEGGRRATARLLTLSPPPDSLLVSNSNLALGVLAELSARGLRAGDDIGLVTFDDAPWTPFTDPPMTVVAQPAYDVGAAAARLLVERIAGHGSAESRRIVLNTTLISRESSTHVMRA